MALTKEIIDSAVERYYREIDRYTKLAEFVGEACRSLLEVNVIRGSVQWRAKNPERLRAKLMKYLSTGEHADEFTDLDSVFRVIKDLAGARITTYVESDREKVVNHVQKHFAGLGLEGRVEPIEKKSPSYRATHCTVLLKDEDLVGRYQNLKDLGCEVQVCSLLAHVYSEIEHDLRYKQLSGDLSKKEDDLLNALGHLMETGDTIINQTLDAVEMRLSANNNDFEDEYDFVVRMRPLLPQATNFASNAGQLFEVCKRLNLDSPEKLKSKLNLDNESVISGKNLTQQLADILNQNQDIQLEIDPLSSDLLLVLILQDIEYGNKLKLLYPSGRGLGRSPRFLSIHKHLHQLLESILLRKDQP